MKPNAYQQYDNYNAIEVPKTNGIPSDYTGVMGVPISFLDSTAQSSLRLSNLGKVVMKKTYPLTANVLILGF